MVFDTGKGLYLKYLHKLQIESLILLKYLFSGVLLVENFFKNTGQSVQSIKAIANDSNQLIIDNILVKLKSMTISRAIMTLTRDLEVQVKLNILFDLVC